MQPLHCWGLGWPTQSTADAEVSVQTTITGHQWGSGMAQDSSVQSAVQTHSWSSCPCSKDLPICCWSFLSCYTSQYELVMLPKEGSFPSPSWACTSSLPILRAAVLGACSELNWRTNPGLCKLSRKEKRKRKKRFNSLLAASWLTVSLIPVLKPRSPVVVSAMRHLNSFILEVAVFHGWVFVLSCEYTVAINFKHSFWLGCGSSARTGLKTWKVRI